MRDWTIENLTPKNIWAVAELQESHYGKVDDTSHAAYLEYLYFQNPAGPVLGYLAWNAAKREAVGGYSLTCVPLKIGTHVESCVSAETLSPGLPTADKAFTAPLSIRRTDMPLKMAA